MFRFRDQAVSWRVAKTRSGRKKQVITNLKALKSIADTIQEEISENDSANIPLCVYYPVNRAVLDIPSSSLAEGYCNVFGKYLSCMPIRGDRPLAADTR